jgi:hypothetical protein
VPTNSATPAPNETRKKWPLDGFETASKQETARFFAVSSLPRRWPTVLAFLLWLFLLGGVLLAPEFTHSSRPGEDLTRNTVRLVLLYYAAATTLMLSLCPADWNATTRRGSLARCCWTLAWAAYVLHVGMALHHFDHWSHDAAVRRTHDRTGFGEGIYISHLFTLLWTADVAYWWLWPCAYAVRRPAIDRALHAFMGVIVFSGTVVFEDGPSRWAGLTLFVWLAAWLVRRRFAFPPGAGAVYDSGAKDLCGDHRDPGSGFREPHHGPSGTG